MRVSVEVLVSVNARDDDEAIDKALRFLEMNLPVGVEIVDNSLQVIDESEYE